MKLKLKEASLQETMNEINSWKLKDTRKKMESFKKSFLNDSSIIPDAQIECSGGHVYYNDGIKVQFPNALREHGRRFTADLRPVVRNGSISFYSAIKGTIVDIKSGNRVG